MSTPLKPASELPKYDLSNPTQPVVLETQSHATSEIDLEKAQRRLNIGYVSQITYNTARFGLRLFGQGHLPALPSFSLHNKMWRLDDNFQENPDSLSSEFIENHFRTQSLLNIGDIATNGALRTFGSGLVIADDSFLIAGSTSFMGTFNIAGPGEALPHIVSLTSDVVDARVGATRALNAMAYTGDSNQVNNVHMVEGYLGSWLASQQASYFEANYFSPFLEFSPTPAAENDLLSSYADIMGCTIGEGSCADDAAWLAETLRQSSQLDHEVEIESFKEQYELNDSDLEQMQELAVAADSANQTRATPSIELGALHQSALGVARMQNAKQQYSYAMLTHASLENKNNGFVLNDHLGTAALMITLNQMPNVIRPIVTDTPFPVGSVLQDVITQGLAIGSIKYSDGNVPLRRSYAKAGFDTFYSLYAPSIFHPLVYANNTQTDVNGRGKPTGNPVLTGLLGAEVVGLGGASTLNAAKATALFWEGRHKGIPNYQGPLMVHGANLLILTGSTLYQTRVKSMPPAISEYYTSETDLNASRKKELWKTYSLTAGADLFSMGLVSLLYATAPGVKNNINNGDFLQPRFLPERISEAGFAVLQNTTFNPDLVALSQGEISGSIGFQLGASAQPPVFEPQFIGIE